MDPNYNNLDGMDDQGVDVEYFQDYSNNNNNNNNENQVGNSTNNANIPNYRKKEKYVDKAIHYNNQYSSDPMNSANNITTPYGYNYDSNNTTVSSNNYYYPIEGGAGPYGNVAPPQYSNLAEMAPGDAMATATYRIPSSAPRKHIPTSFELLAGVRGNHQQNRNSSKTSNSSRNDKSTCTKLSLKQCLLMDLLALMVSTGGPVVEEEIATREEHNTNAESKEKTEEGNHTKRGNPYFYFLTERWDNPGPLYYRWRLYSLVQGDNFLNYKEEPFQIEQGRHSTVLVPPQRELYYNGSRSSTDYYYLLQCVHPNEYLVKMREYYKNSHRNSKNRKRPRDGGGGTADIAGGRNNNNNNEIKDTEFHVLFSPTAEYFSRMKLIYKHLFICLDIEPVLESGSGKRISEEQQWHNYLNIINDGTKDYTVNKTYNGSSNEDEHNSDEKTELEPPVPSPSFSDDTKTDEQLFALQNLSQAQLTNIKNNILYFYLGNSSYIGKLMMFAVEGGEKCFHCFTIILDKIFIICSQMYKLYLALDQTDAPVNLTNNNNVYFQNEIHLKLQIYNSILMFYLFLVHDILANLAAGTKIPTETDLEMMFEKEKTDFPDSPVSVEAEFNNNNNNFINNTNEMEDWLHLVLPLIIEGVVFSNIHSFKILNSLDPSNAQNDNNNNNRGIGNDNSNNSIFNLTTRDMQADFDNKSNSATSNNNAEDNTFSLSTSRMNMLFNLQSFVPSSMETAKPTTAGVTSAGVDAITNNGGENTAGEETVPQQTGVILFLLLEWTRSLLTSWVAESEAAYSSSTKSNSNMNTNYKKTSTNAGSFPANNNNNANENGKEDGTNEFRCNIRLKPKVFASLKEKFDFLLLE